MGLFLFTIEFETKAPELDVIIEEFRAAQIVNIKSSQITKLNEETKCDLWVNPKHKTSILRIDKEIHIEVVLGQPHEISELFIDFLEKKGGKRKNYD
jgi:hypothetical protein